MQALSDKISKRIRRWKRGKIFFANDFSDLGTSGNIRVALHRLVELGLIHRIATGIYLYPEQLPEYLGGGIAYPGHDAVALAIAKKYKLRIAPNVAAAQNMLGLSTQVPMKVSYWTDGSSRSITIDGNCVIQFRHSNKMERFAFRNRLMQIMASALEENNTIDDSKSELIKDLLQHVTESDFAHDIKLFNDKTKDYLNRLRII